MAISMRLLPLTISFASVLLAFKIGQVVQDSRQMVDMLISSVRAEESEKKAEKKEPEAKPEQKKEEKKDEKKEEKKTEGASEKPEAKESAKEGEGEEGKPKEAKKEVPPKPETPSNNLGGVRPEDRRFSPQEMELLQQLVKRREKLDDWEKNIAVKENLLSVTEKRIDEKLVQMEELKKELSAMLVQYNDQENAKIKSLVSIYENMKPREAARIFDEVEMPILLLVIDKMSEKKAAPILAGMDPKKAKQLTVELARQREEQGAKLSDKPKTTAPMAPAVSPAAAASAPAAPAKQ